jgi:TetR/AcrR family transcriptional repressor of nem operon
MAKVTNTRLAILGAADRLLLERGFNGFSYKDISEPMGIKNAAIHYHFSTKEDLGVALFQRYREILRDRTAEFMSRGGNPVSQLEGYSQFILDSFAQRGEICPMGIMAAEFHTLPARMKKQAQLLVDEMIAWLEQVLELGRKEGAFHFEGPGRSKAIAVKSCLQGAAQLARVAGAEVLEEALAQIRRDLRG